MLPLITNSSPSVIFSLKTIFSCTPSTFLESVLDALLRHAPSCKLVSYSLSLARMQLNVLIHTVSSPHSPTSYPRSCPPSTHATHTHQFFYFFNFCMLFRLYSRTIRRHYERNIMGNGENYRNSSVSHIK